VVTGRDTIPNMLISSQCLVFSLAEASRRPMTSSWRDHAIFIMSPIIPSGLSSGRFELKAVVANYSRAATDPNAAVGNLYYLQKALWPSKPWQGSFWKCRRARRPNWPALKASAATAARSATRPSWRRLNRNSAAACAGESPDPSLKRRGGRDRRLRIMSP
jgi:hypothetical protein